MCTFSNETLYLTREGFIYGDSHHHMRKIQANRHLLRIIVFDGQLYGLTKHELAILSIDYYDTSFWVFKKVKWAPCDIVYVNTTLDEDYLWIQTKNKCYLIDCQGYKKKIKTCHKRVYGKNIKNYLEFNNQFECHIVINDKRMETVKGVMSGVMDYRNQIYFVDLNQQYLYCDVRLVNDKPYYIDL